MQTATIHKGMTVREIIALVPAAADIMLEYGLHCFSCSVGGVETLEQGCQIHGFDAETVDALVDDINDAIGQEALRPQTLTVTKEAAEAIEDITCKEGKEGQSLLVTVDEHGGFCLEFQQNALPGDLKFFCKEVPNVHVYASVLTLSRIGGAVIDMRDGRFKLDIDEGCCGNAKDCGCSS